MSRKGRWWRAYDDALHDPKVQSLSGDLFKFWFNVLCVASKHEGKLPGLVELTKWLHVRKPYALLRLTELIRRGLIDETPDGLTPHNWPERQYKSDNSTLRVIKHRNVSKTVSETPPETEADTETDSSLRSEARKRATRLPDEWWPSSEDLTYAQAKGLSSAEISVEAEKFRNHWTSKGGKDAAKLNWHRTWENWVLTAVERKGRANGAYRQPETLEDRGKRLAAEARRLERAAGIGRTDDPFGSH